MARYYIDKSKVTHDRLEDEVIIINVATGSYFSGSGSAADVWSLVSRGTSIADTVRRLAAEYSCDEETVARDVSECIDLLVERGLIQQNDEGPDLKAQLVPLRAGRTSWITPTFDEYTDMWDLIRLDPIHEADEFGWPIPKA
jgi:Coenzyme PQQ synthesis protein D (PqqD)